MCPQTALPPQWACVTLSGVTWTQRQICIHSFHAWQGSCGSNLGGRHLYINKMFVLWVSNQNKVTENFLNLAEVWSLFVICTSCNFNVGKKMQEIIPGEKKLMNISNKKSRRVHKSQACPYTHIHRALLSEFESSGTSPFPAQVLLQFTINTIYIDVGLLLRILTVLLQICFLFLQSSLFSHNLSCPIFLIHLFP